MRRSASVAGLLVSCGFLFGCQAVQDAARSAGDAMGSVFGNKEDESVADNQKSIESPSKPGPPTGTEVLSGELSVQRVSSMDGLNQPPDVGYGMVTSKRQAWVHPVSRAFAKLVFDGPRVAVEFEGERGPWFDQVENLVFNPQGTMVAYVGSTVDGAEVRTNNDVVTSGIESVSDLRQLQVRSFAGFSEDVMGFSGKSSRLVFAKDGSSVMYLLEKPGPGEVKGKQGTSAAIVIDGDELLAHSGRILSAGVAPDGRPWSVQVIDDQRQRLTVGDDAGPVLPAPIGRVRFSSDGKRFSYSGGNQAGNRGHQPYLINHEIVFSKDSPGVDGARISGPHFADDLLTWAYLVFDDRSTRSGRLYVNGELAADVGPGTGTMQDSSAAIGPNGAVLFRRASDDMLVFNGREITRRSDAGRVTFSPDGRRVLIEVRSQAGSFLLDESGKTHGPIERTLVEFSADSRAWICRQKDGSALVNGEKLFTASGQRFHVGFKGDPDGLVYRIVTPNEQTRTAIQADVKRAAQLGLKVVAIPFRPDVLRGVDAMSFDGSLLAKFQRGDVPNLRELVLNEQPTGQFFERFFGLGFEGQELRFVGEADGELYRVTYKAD